MKIKDLPCVYVLATPNFEFIKIGMTKNIKQRLGNIQSGCPYKLSLWVLIKTKYPSEIESRLLSMFSNFNVRGEWFCLPNNELDRLLLIANTENNKSKIEIGKINEMV